jgi:hypothetical protein
VTKKRPGHVGSDSFASIARQDRERRNEGESNAHKVLCGRGYGRGVHPPRRPSDPQARCKQRRLASGPGYRPGSLRVYPRVAPQMVTPIAGL